MPTTTGISFDGVNDQVLKTWTGKTASNNKKFTFAGWFELPTGTSETSAFGADTQSAAGTFSVGLAGSGGLSGIFSARTPFVAFVGEGGSTALLEKGASTFTYGAKYFIMVVYDSAQATASNRLKIWFGPEGGAVTLQSWTFLLSTTYPTLNDTFSHGSGTSVANDYLGGDNAGTYYKGRAADFYWLDNVALADPSSLLNNYATAAAPGTYAGSYGNTGFHLDFASSGSLGADVSGNSNNFTPSGGPTQLTGYFSAAAAYSISAAAGSYAITGTAATLKRGKAIAAAAGSYAVTGAAAGLKRALKVAAAAGSYAVTGTAAGVKRGRKVAAAAGSYAVTGSTAGLKQARKVAASAGSYAVTGTAATLKRGGRVAAAAGSYAVAGTAATIRHAWAVSAAAGSYALTGSSASLVKNSAKAVTADPGAYDVTGANATVRHTWIIGASSGSYAITGTAATLTKGVSKSVGAGVGLYSITGTDASLVSSQTQAAPITGGGGYWPEQRPKYRVHPEYDDTPAPKPKRKVKKIGPQIVIEGEPVIQTGIIEARPAWDALVELQQLRDAAEAARAKKLKALLLADDEWLMTG